MHGLFEYKTFYILQLLNGSTPRKTLGALLTASLELHLDFTCRLLG